MDTIDQAPARRRHTTEDDPRWQVLVSRTHVAGIEFVYGVITTGVYCSPHSPTRLPKPENVVFFDNAAQAEAAGYRRSRRAGSARDVVAARHAKLVAEACRLIEAAEQAPNLSGLAEQACMSAFHFHRVFKKITGLTPKAYASASLRSRVREQLTQSRTITEAVYDAGYNSHSRFYEASQKILGMKPTQYRAGGTDTDIRFAVGASALGAILVAESAKGICAISLGDDANALVERFQDQFPNANLIGGDPEFERRVAEVVGFVESPDMGLNLPLDIRGTVFQERVWQALREVPFGATVTYAQIAERIGMPSAVRAVANACGANTLAVAIPCHRVVRSDGSLSGYRWGVERKRTLLEREQAPRR
ncbi:bifunctional DNA-binding transcriptional regulator/O6-methylguanine-DNA methyltransferase Ada [Pseudomonas sp. KNUC1026]|uniref:bifunctional DNA-binding transcriptional regulator/O6-methylguanine-DNA methyltransferase Ada n=1 Tax=Pseudomonas sp. KNUC1026 TaxID=2893890 RepID=UPI001F3AD595|nr:bifunctional DNA-binding transcriptional regulator/O6-methylguanine-DNA methyltransferase Ada [Pseudomonas sp. KNUC1026]UFH48314.1 bifunctional DNA-binding transcriptional regulator/O6-methylguanine-DNA methyltransferase Ada [Pseudomonas sp. KNUC1026]